MSKVDLEKMRQKLKDRKAGFTDPNQFIPPVVQANDDKKYNYRFFVLAPVAEGEITADGPATKSMELYYVPNGSHWHAKRPHACPRIHDDEDCSMCTYGFELMGETTVKAERSKIAKAYLPQQRNAVNIYFTNDAVNPEELRGKNMWFNAPKACLDVWDACMMRDSAGDPADPQPFGDFMDPNASYVFQLEVGRKGDYNDYTGSKFLPGLGKIAIARGKTAEGKIVPHVDKIKQILDGRFDLFTKFDARNPTKLAELVTIVSGVAAGSGFNEDENKQPTNVAPAATAGRPKPAPAAGKPAPAKAAPVTAPASSDIVGEGLELLEPSTPPKAAPPKAAPAKTASKPAAKAAPAPAPVETIAEAPVESANSDEAELEQLLAEVADEQGT